MRTQGWRNALLALLTAIAAGASTSGVEAQDAPHAAVDHPERRWSFHIDNDLFAFADRDRDYTAGLTFTLSGDRARTHWLSPAHVRDWADRTTRFTALRGDAAPEGDALELGLLLFTPRDLAAERALPDDRPYANLLYVASSALALDEQRRTAYVSTLSLGFLGLPFAERFHIGIHALTGSAEPRGYSHQISDGGEPTFMYAVSRYRLLHEGTYRGVPYSVRLGAGASVGYLTEANAEIAFRTNAQWWSSSPASADYTAHPQIGGPLPPARGRPQVQLEAGVKLHARVYDSFLQGQFRHSDVTFESSELNHALLDAWLGATTVLKSGLSISYSVHHQTKEIEKGSGARNFTWASIGIVQGF